MLAVTRECPSEFSLPSRIPKLNGLAPVRGRGGGGGHTLGADMILASMFWSVRDPGHDLGWLCGDEIPPKFSRPRLDSLEYGSDELLRGFHFGRIFGVRFTQAWRVWRPRIMSRRL